MLTNSLSGIGLKRARCATEQIAPELTSPKREKQILAKAPIAGRPRSEAVHSAVISAVTSLLHKKPYNDISIEAIAVEAGVSKASIYRRWANKPALMVEVLALAAEKVAQKGSFDGETYRDQLISGLKGLRAMLKSDFADAIVAVISEAQKDDTLSQLFRQRFINPVQAIGDQYLKAAMERGEVRSDIDMDMVFDQMFGTFYYCLLIANKPIDDAYVERIVDNVLKQIS